MKKLDFSKIAFRAIDKEDWSKEAKKPFNANTIVFILFSQLAQKKLERAATMDQQRMYAKIQDALEAEGPVELSDEKFDFMWDVFQTPFALTTMLPPIVDYLEAVKLAK